MIVDQIFQESVWTAKIPKQYRIETIIIKVGTKDIDFLTDDETNFDPTKMDAYQQLCAAIVNLKRSVFLKIAGRTAKDSSALDRRITNIKSLIMLVKMSEYLTQALCDSEGETSIILKEYVEYLDNGNDQFRVYVFERNCVGICQKITNFIGISPTINQIDAIKKCTQEIKCILLSHVQSCVFEVYVSPNGKQLKIISIEPFYIHALSLFKQQQLINHSKSKKPNPLIKFVESEHELKDTDLSQYRIGSQLKQKSKVSEWIQFMKKADNEQILSND